MLVKGVFASIVLMIVFLTVTVRAQMAAVDKRVTVTSSGKTSSADSVPSEVTYIPKEKVAAAFAKGGALSEWSDGQLKYGVRIARHDKPELVEVHALKTHIFYVLEGSATYVTGGTVVDPKTTEPNEIRGSAIDGGEVHHLSKGDVFIVPKGVPHWTKDVESPIIIFTVNIP
jgi:mannose-6-phosphate isomerase-like protein (cupin superfamily)